MNRLLLRTLLATTIVGAFLATTAGPALASGPRNDDSRISVTGPVRIESGQRINGPVISVHGSVRVNGVVDGDVFVVRGDVTVAGRVTGTVTALDGNIRVLGRVGDGVTATSGRAVIGAGAVVGGDVRSSERPSVASAATVSGDVSKTNFAAWFTLAGWIALILWWLAVTITLLVIGLLFVLLFPKAAQAVTVAGRGSTGSSIGWGALLGLGVPLVAGALGATFVGLPLGLGMLVLLAVAFPLGYVMTALIIGRSIARGVHDAAAFLIGFAILRALAIIPGLGWVIGFLAAAFGVGALAVAAWRAGRATPASSPPPAVATAGAVAPPE